MKRRRSGFTLLEIMIVVTLIGVLAAVAIPSFQQAVAKTQARTCILNLKAIETAKAQWMADAKKSAEDTPSDAELFGEQHYIRDKPKCPSGGVYQVGTAGAKPLCSVPGHSY